MLPISEVVMKIQAIRRLKQGLDDQINELVSEHMPDYCFYHHVGTWNCEKSPIGLCVYNFLEDPYFDDCIFCHNPQERK